MNCGACGARPAETCNARDDNCDGRCDEGAGCRHGVHRSANGSTGEHFYTTSASEAMCCGFVVESLNYFYLYNATQPGTTTLYRCLSRASGTDHFCSTDASCEGQIVEGPMGFIGTSAVCGSTPLYRAWDPRTGTHLFTTDAAERATVVAAGWTDEGVVGHVWRD